MARKCAKRENIYQRKVSRPQSTASASAAHTRSDHAVASAFRAVEREVLVFPADAACEAALAELELDVFEVERVGGGKVERGRGDFGERARDADAADGRAVVAEQERRRTNGQERHLCRCVERVVCKQEKNPRS